MEEQSWVIDFEYCMEIFDFLVVFHIKIQKK